MKYSHVDDPAVVVKIDRELLEGAVACLKAHLFHDPELIFRTLGGGLYQAFGHFSSAQIAEGIAEAKTAGSDTVVLENVVEKRAAVPEKKETAAGSGLIKPN